MNILLYDMGSYIQNDLIFYLQQAGHHCKNIPYTFQSPLHDDFFEYRFTKYLKEDTCSCVISTNFHPLVAKICYQNDIKYLAWIYDSPIDKDFMEYYAYPTSYMFLFDRLEVQYFKSHGIEHAFHLPLAVNTKRLDAIPVSSLDKETYTCDVSLVGQFYKSPLNDFLPFASDYDRGFVQAIVDTQSKIYGYNFLDEAIDSALISRMNDTFNQKGLIINGKAKDGFTREGLIHSICRQITYHERLVLLKLLNNKHDVRYYSTACPEILSDVKYCGSTYYFSEMPKIFRFSKININASLRSIQSGIPLRALDIIGSRGFLLSNYQAEFEEYFVPGQDIVLYDSIPDAIEKANFYLSNESERQNIINRSFNIIETYFNYPMRIAELFRTAGLY